MSRPTPSHERESAYELLQRGHALMRSRHNAQAAVVLERAARIEPGKGSILEALGRACFNSGQHDRSRVAFERLLEVDPSSPVRTLRARAEPEAARAHPRGADPSPARRGARSGLGAVPRRAGSPGTRTGARRGELTPQAVVRGPRPDGQDSSAATRRRARSRSAGRGRAPGRWRPRRPARRRPRRGRGRMRRPSEGAIARGRCRARPAGRRSGRSSRLDGRRRRGAARPSRTPPVPPARRRGPRGRSPADRSPGGRRRDGRARGSGGAGDGWPSQAAFAKATNASTSMPSVQCPRT